MSNSTIQAPAVKPIKKARLSGISHVFSLDALSKARTQHISLALEAFGVSHSYSSIVRRALCLYSRHIDRLIEGEDQTAIGAERMLVQHVNGGETPPWPTSAEKKMYLPIMAELKPLSALVKEAHRAKLERVFARQPSALQIEKGEAE